MSALRLPDAYRTAFVTGASAGLGRAFCEMLLEHGILVWGTSRDISRLKPLCAWPGFTAVAMDLEAPLEAEASFIFATEQAGGSFDLIVQNAGYGVFAPFSSVHFSSWQRQFDAMVVTTARLSHAAFSRMQARRRGCIVHVASMATEFPIPYMSGYNVSKAALSALSESLMMESMGTGVSVIDFRPGDYCTGFNTRMQEQSLLSDDKLQRVWGCLEKNLQEAPGPERAAEDLCRALRRGTSGIVRSGSFFQTKLAPLLASLAPSALRRKAMALYFRSY